MLQREADGLYTFQKQLQITNCELQIINYFSFIILKKAKHSIIGKRMPNFSTIQILNIF